MITGLIIYHRDKITNLLGFKPQFSIEMGIEDLREAFEKKLLTNSLGDPKYFNIKTMQKNKFTMNYLNKKLGESLFKLRMVENEISGDIQNKK